MNDRAVSVLNNYDCEALRSWKGRSAILCETKNGIVILKEYKGSSERIEKQQKMLRRIQENGYLEVEQILPNKEGELITRDADMVPYVLKEYREGRECSLKETKECCYVAENMARLHNAMELSEFVEEEQIEPYLLPAEFEKRNRELKKVRRFLKEKGQKTDFELALTHYYDFFYEKARRIYEECVAREDIFNAERIKKEGCLCHGDFQHHNALLEENQVFVMNFEKYLLDSPTRDLSLFLRKFMEKNNWSEPAGRQLLHAYHKVRKLDEKDWVQIYFRIAYPEKFWKIVNFYYNNGKSWIPERNLEKLEKLLKQEEEKKYFLNKNFSEWVLRNT